MGKLSVVHADLQLHVVSTQLGFIDDAIVVHVINNGDHGGGCIGSGVELGGITALCRSIAIAVGLRRGDRDGLAFGHDRSPTDNASGGVVAVASCRVTVCKHEHTISIKFQPDIGGCIVIDDGQVNGATLAKLSVVHADLQLHVVST